MVALRLAPEPSLNKPPTEAQYAPEAQQLQDPATLTHAQVHFTRIFLIKIGSLIFISIVIGGSGTGGSCQDGADPNNWCHDVNSWACTNPTYQQYFTTNCKTLCGLCSGGGEYYIVRDNASDINTVQVPIFVQIGSSNCQDKNEWGYCQAQFQYACTDNRYRDWFVRDCEKLSGQC